MLELKALEAIAPIHVAQILSYLKATRLRLGLLITFNVAMLRRGIKRVVLTPSNLGALGVLAVRPLPALLLFSGGALVTRSRV